MSDVRPMLEQARRPVLSPVAMHTVAMLEDLGVCVDVFKTENGFASPNELDRFGETIAPALEHITDPILRQRTRDAFLIAKGIQVGLRVIKHQGADALFSLPDAALTDRTLGARHLAGQTPDAIYTATLFLLRGDGGGDVPHDANQRVSWGYTADFFTLLPQAHRQQITQSARRFHFTPNAAAGMSSEPMSLNDVVLAVSEAVQPSWIVIPGEQRVQPMTAIQDLRAGDQVASREENPYRRTSIVRPPSSPRLRSRPSEPQKPLDPFWTKPVSPPAPQQGEGETNWRKELHGNRAARPGASTLERVLYGSSGRTLPPKLFKR